MKKKLIVILVIVAVLVPATLSAKLLDISLGPNVQFVPDFATLSSDDDVGELFANFDNYAFGADLRLKILLAEIDLVSTFGKHTDTSTDKEYTSISVLTSAGVSFDFFGFTRLGIGLGPRFNILLGEDEMKIMPAAGGPIETVDDFGDAFVKSPLALRATADFKVGKMWLGASYTLDTLYTFENYDQLDKLFEANWDTGKFGVSLLFSLF